MLYEQELFVLALRQTPPVLAQKRNSVTQYKRSRSILLTLVEITWGLCASLELLIKTPHIEHTKKKAFKHNYTLH